MADDLATYAPEVVAPIDVPSPADIEQQTASQLGQFSQQSKQMYETMTTGPLTSKLESEALQQGAAFEAPTAFTQGQAQANQQALQLNRLAMQSDASVQSQKYFQQAVAQDGFTPKTLQDYQNNMQGYAQGQLNSASPSMRPFVQESLIRQGALTTNVIGKKVQQYNVAQNLNNYNDAQRQASGQMSAIGTQPFSVAPADQPENMTLPESNLNAALTSRLQLTNLAQQGTLIGKQQAVKDHHSAYMDFYSAKWAGPYRQALANDQAADLQTSSQGKPSVSTQGQDYLNKLGDPNTQAGEPHIGPADVKNIVTKLKGVEATSNAEGQEAVTSNNNDINSLKLQALHGGTVDSGLYGRVAANNGLSIGEIGTQVGENVQANNVATAISGLPIATQENRLNSLKTGNDASTPQLQKLGFSADSISRINKGVTGLVSDNLSLASGKNADTGQYIDNNLAWQKVLGNSVITNPNLQSGNDQNIVKNATSLIPQFNIDKNGNVDFGLTDPQSDALKSIMEQKSNYSTQTLGVPFESASLYSKGQNAQLVKSLETQEPSVQATILKKYSNLYGSSFPLFMHGILKAGYNPIGMLAGGVTDNDLNNAIDEAGKTNFNILKKTAFSTSDTPTADFNTIKANVNTALAGWTSQTLEWPDVNKNLRGDQVTKMQSAILSTAMVLHQNGMSLSDAATKAASLVTDKGTLVGGTMIPNQITAQVPDPARPGKTKPQVFNMPDPNYVSGILDGLKRSQLGQLAENIRSTNTLNGKAVTPQVAATNAEKIEDEIGGAKFINSPDGTRAVLISQFGTPFNVTVKGVTRPLAVNWSDVFNPQAQTTSAKFLQQIGEAQTKVKEFQTNQNFASGLAGLFQK